MAITTNVTSATKQTTSYTNNGFTTDTVGGVTFPLQQGVPYQNLYTFKVIPAVDSNTCVTSSQAWPGSGVSYTLNTADTTSGTQTISKYVYYNGTHGIKLDCERAVSLTVSGTTTTTTYITVTGYDYRGVAVSYISGISSGLTGTFCMALPISIVTGIYASANPGVNLSFGNSGADFSDYATIGLPYYLPSLSYIVSCAWDGESIAVSSSTVKIGNPWRSSPPTSLGSGTQYARGGVILPSAPDGSKMLLVTYFVYGSDSEINSELQNNIQSTLNIVDVQQNTDSQYVWPYLTKYDLVGMQYPGDLTVAEAYDVLINA